MTDEDTPITPDQPTTPEPTPTEVTQEVPPTPDAGAGVHTGAPSGSGARKTSRLSMLVIYLVALLVVGGGAIAGVLYMLRGSGDVLIDKAPADSLIYATVYLDPAAGQKVNLLGLADKFPALQREGLGKQFNALMNDALSGMDMTYEDDIEPWVGSQVGVIVLMDGDEPGAAFMVDSADDAAAEAALNKLRANGLEMKDTGYEGTTISVGDGGATATVDGAVVFASSEGVVKRIIDTARGGESLSGNAAYSEAMTGLPEERVAAAFVNGAEIFSAVKEEVGSSGLGAGETEQIFDSLEAFKGMGMVVAIEPDGVAMEFASIMDTSKLPENTQGVSPHQNAVLAWSPEDSYGVVTGTGLGGALKGFLDQMDQASPGSSTALDTFGVGAAIEALEGDYGLVVNPGHNVFPGGAFLMASKDDAAMQDFLDSLSVFITQAASEMSGGGMNGAEGGPVTSGEIGDSMLPIKMSVPMWQTEVYEGVTISFLPLPDPEMQQMGIAPSYAISDGMAIIASSPEEIKALIDTKGGTNVTANANYRSAIAHADAQNTSLMFMNIEQILDTVKQVVPMEGSEDIEAMANMEPFKAFITTSGGTSERPTATVFILIQ